MAPIYIMIDQEKTGRNILDLMNRKGMQVKDIQGACGFEKPQAVYKWLHGQTLPSIDNLLILSRLFETDLEGILTVSEDALPRSNVRSIDLNLKVKTCITAEGKRVSSGSQPETVVFLFEFCSFLRIDGFSCFVQDGEGHGKL